MPEPINITFLGTGAAIPSLKRRPAAILFHYGSEYFLFDCGEGTQIQLQKARISPMRLKALFITHWHADHFAGILPLIETLHLSRRSEALDVYGPEASRFIDALIEMSYWGIGFRVIAKDCGEEEIEKLVETDTYEIYSIRVKHSVPSVGYCFKERDHWNIDIKKAEKFDLAGKDLKKIKADGKIKTKKGVVKIEQIANKKAGRKIVYSGDTEICETLLEFSKDADILIHDGTFVEAPDEDRPHASAVEVAKMAKKYNVKKLVLTHLSRRYKGEEDFDEVKKIFKDTIIAKDMMKITLK